MEARATSFVQAEAEKRQALRAEPSSCVQVCPKSASSQSCFFRACIGPTLRLSLNQRRSVMQVLFKSRHPQAAELRGLAERRVRFALRRLGWLVPRAEVQMSDVNGPRGGVDKRCQVELRTDGAGSVVVASVAKDWRTALDHALKRAARFLMRLWRRGSDSRRMRQRLIAHEG
jgi:ribosome-associated translation inhibitor RaiA